MKKRVAHFLGSLHLGGTERQAVSIIRSLADSGNFAVFAATLDSSGPLAGDLGRVGLPPVPEFRLNSFYSVGFLNAVRLCASWLRRERIDLVHTHDFYTNVFGMTAASAAGVQVKIASKRETVGMRSGAQWRVERMAFRSADAIIANAVAVKEYLANEGVASEKIEMIYNEVDAVRSAADRAEAPMLPEGKRFITSVANLRHEVKNIPMLLDAFAMIANEYPDVDLVIAGEGELREGLEGHAARVSVRERTHFIGRCDNVAAVLARSDIGVLTSNAEGFSNSILEYMAAGLPVVATDVGGAREAVIDGGTGYIVPPGDTSVFAARLTKLLTDTGLSGSFGRKGKERAEEQFSPSKRLLATEHLYSRFLN